MHVRIPLSVSWALPIGLLVPASPTWAQARTEDFKITAPDPGESDSFGYSVALFGPTAVVGAPLEDGPGESRGAAYVFDIPTRQRLFRLAAADTIQGGLGHDVAVFGTIAVVAAPGDWTWGPNSGSVFLFSTLTGELLRHLTAPDGAPEARFGFSVGIFGSTAVVGAIYDEPAGPESGSVYVFDTASGAMQRKLIAADADAGDSFGFSVAINGTTAIVGSPLDDDAGSNSGSAYIFDTSTGAQLFKLTASDAAEGDRFGYSVAIGEGIAAVGAIWDDDAGSESGAVYLFDASTGEQLFKLTAPDAEAEDQFGQSVGLFGDVAVIGAAQDARSVGSAYLFDTTNGHPLFKFAASDGAEGDFFGHASAIDGSSVIVGAFWHDDGPMNAGSAYVLDLTPCNAADLAPPPGILNQDDIDAFASAFLGGTLDADLNGDAALNVDDIDAFVAGFLSGCP